MAYEIHSHGSANGYSFTRKTVVLGDNKIVYPPDKKKRSELVESLSSIRVWELCGKFHRLSLYADRTWIMWKYIRDSNGYCIEQVKVRSGRW